MDNTANGQNPNPQNTSGQTVSPGQPLSGQAPLPDIALQSPPIPAPVVPQQPVQSAMPQMQQPASTGPALGVNPTISQPIPNSPSLPQQPLGDAQAVTQQQVQSSAQNNKKITLDDLYGPSGLATEGNDLQPLAKPLASSQQVSIAESISQTPSVPENASVNTQAAIPDETLSQQAKSHVPENVQKEETPASSTSQPAESSNPLPLRKGQGVPQLENNTVTPPQPVSPPPSENSPQGKRINKLFLLRIIFGVVGAGIVMLLIFLGFQAFTTHFSATPSGKVTLTYWGLWEDSNTMQSIISTFEKDHPDITIQYEKQDPKEYSQRLLTRIKQGNGPDIFTYHSSWLPMVQPVLVPLPTSVISKNDLEKSFYPVVSRDLVENGAIYGVPLEVDTLALFVNNKMFSDAKAQVPTTWDTFVTTARALTVKDENGKIKVAGAAMGTFDNITHAPDILSTLFMQNGVDITTMTPKSNATDALSFYTSFATGNSTVWDNTLDPSQLAFARGNLAMYFGYSWDVFAIKAANPNLNFTIYPMPHLPGRNTTAASYWVEGVANNSAHQKEAFEFMQFLAQKSTAATLYSEEAKTRLFGEPYAQVDLGDTLKDNPLVYPFVSQAMDAKSSFFAGETQDTGLNGQMNGYLGNAVRGVLGNTSPDSAIDTLTQGVLQIEKQYGSS